MLRLRRVDCPDEFGRMQRIDALTIDFDYDGTLTPADDERQFVRVPRPGDTPGNPESFVRRDRTAECRTSSTLLRQGSASTRCASPKANSPRGRMVYVYRGRDASERWQGFVAERVPALQALGWQAIRSTAILGPRLVQFGG